jgi:hypothetical protein
MSVLLRINPNFFQQVALSCDEAAMEVLDWLEGRSFEWDMCVDLPANRIRYQNAHLVLPLQMRKHADWSHASLQRR